ncbi:MAG: hypothetical protein U5R49_01595 [Deltaproteobacteria bacterium]|nr:hypothetical protein [Deltaproteobacteria bacterium]
MNEYTRRQLEEELKKMLTDLAQTECEEEQPKTPPGTGNFILRRTGKKDKRFSINL